MFYRHKIILPSIFILFTSIFHIGLLNAQESNVVSRAEIIKNLNVVNKSTGVKNKPVNSKAGPRIQKLINNPGLMKSSTARKLTSIKDDSLVQVYIKLKSTNESEIDSLKELGLEVEIVNDKFKKVQGWSTLDHLNQITELDNVIHVTAPNYAHKRVGIRTTQGDAILGSNLIRAQGFTGEGVKVGVISDGSAGLFISQASGDLPSNVTLFDSCEVVSFGDCSEGTAIAEIIHDIAPDAELAIADALGSSLEFIQRVEQLANEFNADIIIDDLGFFDEPYFEDGDIAQTIIDLPPNIIFVSAAGNEADRHYQATYVPSSIDSFHDFAAAANAPNTNGFGDSFVDLEPGATFCATLQWNDPFEAAVNNYDLFIFDESNNVAGLSTSTGPIASELACATNATITEARFFVTINLLEGAATERAITVGTINVQDPLQDDIAIFSNQGPSRIDFPTRQDRQKPDITGVDGVSVTGAGGFPQTFFGTSAAAPHIAGIAALMKSARPSATAEEIKSALINGAVDLGEPGKDTVFGAGRANAEDSLELILSGGFKQLRKPTH